MKLRYKGIKSYVILPMIKTEKQKARIERNDIFDCTPEVASDLLKWNKQYVRPIFEDVSEINPLDLDEPDTVKADNKMAPKPKTKTK